LGIFEDIQSSKKINDQLRNKGLTVSDIEEQLEVFKRGMPPVNLVRSATLEDGIRPFPEDRIKALRELQEIACGSGRMQKFVPASGAATRMFKSLQELLGRSECIDMEYLRNRAENSDIDAVEGLKFFENIDKFAFFDQLNQVLAKEGQSYDELRGSGKLKAVLSAILNKNGLGFGDTPKGLIPFHQYSNHTRTPIAEHFREALKYCRDDNGVARIHFTVQAKHLDSLKDHVEH
jgi:hypothetical protein